MFKNCIKSIMIGSLVLVLAGSMVMPALAADDSEPKSVPAAPFDGESIRRFFSGSLMRTFRYQKSMAVFIGNVLESGADSADNAIDRIATLKKEGKDIHMLEEAVADYEELYTQAQADQQAALALVDAHAGFDLRGRVENINVARATIKAIEPYLSGARENMVDAIQTITNAMQEFCQENSES